jgi:type II secretory pathway component PulM
MITTLTAWWRARSARERGLIQVLAVIALVIVAPLALYRAAQDYRASAKADLEAAQQVARDVATLAKGKPAGPTTLGDGTLRGRVVALAQAEGLAVDGVEPLSGGRLRVRFAASSSVGVYRWLAACARQGVQIGRAAIVRAGEGDVVTAEFEIATGA